MVLTFPAPPPNDTPDAEIDAVIGLHMLVDRLPPHRLDEARQMLGWLVQDRPKQLPFRRASGGPAAPSPPASS